jgi:methionyl-tRNA formyltransferase
MRLVFLGSPEPANIPLKILVENAKDHGHELVGVVSQPARPVGRKQVMQDPPVATYAKSVGLPVYQPEKARDPEFLKAFEALKPDVAITAAYGQILTPEFLKIPTRATINIHPSLLPKYRGATPVPAALLAGEKVSGVTILFTVQKLDAGAIILQESLAIDPQECADALTARYFALGSKLLFPALEKLQDPSFAGTPQDEESVTHCRKIDKQDGNVIWSHAAEDIYNRFRAFTPWPSTFTFHEGRRLQLTAMMADPSHMTGQIPGTVTFDKTRASLAVATGEGTLYLTKIKPSGGKEIPAASFWNGLKDRSAVRFSSIDGST